LNLRRPEVAVEGFAVLLGLIGIGLLVGVPVAAFVALARTTRLHGEVAGLAMAVATLQTELAALRKAVAPQASRRDPLPQAREDGAVDRRQREREAIPAFRVPVEPQPERPAPTRVEPPPAIVEPAPTRGDTIQASTALEPPADVAAAPPVETVATSVSLVRPSAAPTAPAETLEERLGVRLFIWIGGIALALAGAFLVKYSIDQGWLGPSVRCALGAALGVALLAGGEWMRVRDGRIAQSVSAAGVAVLYAALFAAIALYELIDSATGFLLLAALTAAAIALALRQGPFVALLGLAGGFLTPAIVRSDEPSAFVLFGYLFAIQLGTQILRYRRGWWWPSAIAVAGGLLWTVLWLVDGPRAWSDDAWLAVFLLATAAAATWAQRATAMPARLQDWTPAHWQPTATHALALVLMAALVAAADFGLYGWLFLGLFAAGEMALARFRGEHEPLAAFAIALAACLLTAWPLPSDVFTTETARFVAVVLGAGALVAGGGFAGLWGARQPARWALLSAIGTAAFFLIAYGRVRGLEALPPWGLVSLVVAALHVAAAERVARYRAAGPGYEEALGAFALAASFFIALAIPLELEHGWIAVGWALLLPAIAWIDSRLRIAWLRYAAWIAAGLVLARLVPGPWVFGVPTGATPIFNWLLYGYGIPLAAFAGAAWLFCRQADDALVTFLEAGAVAIGFLLVTLELHHYFQGGLVYRFDLGLVEVTSFAVAWLLIALGLARAARLDPRPAHVFGTRVVTGLAAAVLVVGSLVSVNPLLSLEPVGDLPLLNWLAFAYAVPALLLVAIAREIEGTADRGLAIWPQALAGVFGLLFVSLEIRQLFHGADLVLRDIGLTELSCLIAAWLVIAIGLAYALRRYQRPVLLGGVRVVAALAVASLIAGPLLAFNPLLSWQSVGAWPLFNLLLLTYGLPALLLAALGYALGPVDDGRLASALQGLAGIVGLFFISLEIRQLFHGAVLVLGDLSLAELSCLVIAWLLIALGLLRLGGGLRQAQFLTMARVVTGLAVLALVFGSLVYANPLLSVQSVGGWPLLNWLIPAYAVPALLVAVLNRDLCDPQRLWMFPGMAILSLVLGFAFVTLELRQWFHGSRLDLGGVTNAETYAYSVGWILYGLALLAAGIVKGGQSLRYASLAVIVLAVGKVFLIDAAALTGLYRVASFLGLGLSLLAIGYAYQRFVFVRTPAPSAAVTPPPMQS
jgi:uncharacterized membrane protein